MLKELKFISTIIRAKVYLSFHLRIYSPVHLSLTYRGTMEIPKKTNKNRISLTPGCTPPQHRTQADYQMNFSNFPKTFVLINVANNKVEQWLTCQRRRNERAHVPVTHVLRGN